MSKILRFFVIALLYTTFIPALALTMIAMILIQPALLHDWALKRAEKKFGRFS